MFYNVSRPEVNILGGKCFGRLSHGFKLPVRYQCFEDNKLHDSKAGTVYAV